MSLLSLFFPKTWSFHSAFNRDVKIVERGKKYTLFINNTPQSGGEFEFMWEKIIKNLTEVRSGSTKCLVLGLGGGTAIKYLRKYFTNAHVTAVEIDALIVKLAKDYFGIENEAKTKIVTADANLWIRDTKEKYDLVIVDIFSGRLNPEWVRQIDSLENLRKLLTPQGAILFNAHYLQNDKKEFEEFTHLCQSVFPKVKEVFSYPRNKVLMLYTTSLFSKNHNSLPLKH